VRDARTPRRRLLFVLAGVFVWAIVIVIRLLDIQVHRADDLRELARRQQLSEVEVDPVRGTILDRHGVELAISKDVRSVYAVPRLLDDAEQTADHLAEVLGIDRRRTLARLQRTDRDFVWIARKITDAQAATVDELALPGISFRDEPKRFYPRGGLAAHVLGFAGLDNVGLAGLEQQFDADISGIPGWERIWHDARGQRVVPQSVGTPAEPGSNLVLTIDASIQYVVERELEAAVTRHRARRATAVAMDPWTGQVIAMAAAPSFDPNQYGRSSPRARRNSAVQESYEPGSTFKVITFAAALEEGRLDLHESIDCGRGGIRVGRTRIRDHKSFDFLSPTEIITFSSNVGAIVVGSRVPRDDFYGHIRRFGFGARTGIELPGETSGLLARPSRWSGLTRASVSMGQEIAVTPLQLVTAFSAVVNGGTLLRPHLVLRLEEPDGTLVRERRPRSIRRVISSRTSRTLIAMMENVVREGTSTRAQLDGVSVAGKSGTAQKAGPGGYVDGKYVASFIGFAPSERPRLVVLVTIDEPRQGHYGGLLAAPVVGRILSAAMKRLGEPAEGQAVEIPLVDYYPPEVTPPDDGVAVLASR